MNKTLLISVAIAALYTHAFSAERTAVTSGDWSAKDTWGGTIPVDGDTAIIGDKLTVTVSDERTIGASGANDTTAINLGKSGAIVVAKGGLLRVRGDVVYTAGLGNLTTAVTVQGGGTWRWDASKAAEAAKTQYKFGPSADLGFRAFIMAGTEAAHAVLDSDPAGGAGYLTRKNYGGSFQCTYGDISRIGDGKTPGWDPWWYAMEGKHLVAWDVQHSTFTQCGAIRVTGDLRGDGTFRHNRNVHVSTQGEQAFTAIRASGEIGKGVREIVGNVFDVAPTEWIFPGGLTICGNYFGNGMRVHMASDPWAKCEGNFVRLAKGGGVMANGKRFADSYVFIDTDQDNPHVLASSGKIATDMDGLIMGHAGTANVDSGEWIFGSHEFLVSRCIILPNSYGYSSGEMGVLTGDWLDVFPKFEHNVWFGGFAKGGTTDTGFPAMQYSESGNNKTGQVRSFRSNILWNPQLPGKEANFVKFLDVHSTGRDQKEGPVEDVGKPADIDCNTGWGYTKEVKFPNIGHFTNWGRGYIGKWSATPGAHDVDVDPEFADYQRSVELFATKGLGKTASRGEWSAKPDKPYAVGDTVGHATGIEWGLPILYRYIGTGENPEPGLGTRERGDTGNWRKSWEWASLYNLREGVRKGEKFGAAAGATQPAGDDVIMHLLKWVRAGYAPMNVKLKGAAHDGTDIGAVPWQPKSASQPATAPK